MCMYVCMYVCVYMYVVLQLESGNSGSTGAMSHLRGSRKAPGQKIYIYIYMYTHTYMYVYIYIHVYDIYIYIVLMMPIVRMQMLTVRSFSTRVAP